MKPGVAEAFAGVDCGYRRRFCYAPGGDALRAAVKWDGEGDPPGPWIKEKSPPPGPADRLNPALAREDFAG